MRMPLSSSQTSELQKLVVDHGFTTKGPLGIALVVVDRAATSDLPLKVSDFLTGSGGQVKGATPSAVGRILKKYDIHRVLAREVGRTSRGSISRMERLVALINRWHADDTLDLKSLEEFWIERVKAYFASTPIMFRLDPALGLRSTFRSLMVQAEARQREAGGTMIVGTVMQHLVGAKLEAAMAIRGTTVNHHGSNQNDVSGRGGDFDLGEAVIHVTTAPSTDLLRKCRANLGMGWRPIIVTTSKGVYAAEVLGETEGIEGRFDVLDFDQFMATNLHELGAFQTTATREAIIDIVDRYNRIVNEVETDPSLAIEIG